MKNPLLNEASSVLKLGDHGLAEKLYLVCLDQNSNDAEALRELALIEYGFKKNSVKAKELIEQSLKIEDCAMGHFYLALILDNLRIYPQAEEEFEYSIKESKGDTMMNSMYGDVLVAQKRFDKAKLHFIAALLKEPDYKPAQESYAQLLKILNESPASNLQAS